MPRVKNTSRFTNGTITQMRPSIILVHSTFTLKRLYAHTPLANIIHGPLVQFPPLSGPCTNLLEHCNINHPDFVYFDITCFMMLTMDLPALFGITVCPANRKVLVKNLPKFHD